MLLLPSQSVCSCLVVFRKRVDNAVHSFLPIFIRIISMFSSWECILNAKITSTSCPFPIRLCEKLKCFRDVLKLPRASDNWRTPSIVKSQPITLISVKFDYLWRIDPTYRRPVHSIGQHSQELSSELTCWSLALCRKMCCGGHLAGKRVPANSFFSQDNIL